MWCLTLIIYLIVSSEAGVGVWHNSRSDRWEWNEYEVGTNAPRDDNGPLRGGGAITNEQRFVGYEQREAGKVRTQRDLDWAERETGAFFYPRGLESGEGSYGPAYGTRQGQEEYEEEAEEMQPAAPPPCSSGWGLPSMSSVKGWASSAYSTVPSLKTVTSYLPESVQSYLPSRETVQSYLPTTESLAARVPESVKNPRGYVARNLSLGGTLPPEDSEKLTDAISDRILKGDGKNLDDAVAEVGQNAMGRAVERAGPQIVKSVARKVVFAMVASYVGIFVAGLAKGRLDQLADAIAERAIEQYQNYDGPYKLDLMSYMKTINWKAIANKGVEMARAYMG